MVDGKSIFCIHYRQNMKNIRKNNVAHNIACNSTTFSSNLLSTGERQSFQLLKVLIMNF